jgi:hypothetical protein
MTQPVLNMQAALVRVANNVGYLLPPWNSFFQQLVQPAPAVQAITVSASPFSYTANANGSLIISGGTISDIDLVRGLDTIPLSIVTPLIVPIRIGDTVIVTYSVLPTVQFLGA